MERLVPGHTSSANKDGRQDENQHANSYSDALSRTEEEGKGMRTDGEEGRRHSREEGGSLGTPCCCASCREILTKQGASVVPMGEAGS